MAGGGREGRKREKRGGIKGGEGQGGRGSKLVGGLTLMCIWNRNWLRPALRSAACRWAVAAQN